MTQRGRPTLLDANSLMRSAKNRRLTVRVGIR